MTLKEFNLFNIVIGVALGLTLLFVILSCFNLSDVFLWLSLLFGVITFVAGITRYLRLGKNS